MSKGNFETVVASILKQLVMNRVVNRVLVCGGTRGSVDDSETAIIEVHICRFTMMWCICQRLFTTLEIVLGENVVVRCYIHDFYETEMTTARLKQLILFTVISTCTPYSGIKRDIYKETSKYDKCKNRSTE